VKRHAKPTIPKARVTYLYSKYCETDTYIVEQAYDGDTYVGVLLTPKSGGKIEFLEGKAGHRYISKLQDSFYAKMK